MYLDNTDLASGGTGGVVLDSGNTEAAYFYADIREDSGTKQIEIMRADALKNAKINKIDAGKKRFINLLLMSDKQEEMIDMYLDRSDMYVIYWGGAVVGECVVMNVFEDVFEIKNIAVRDEYRNRGFGRRLIRFVENEYKGLCSILLAGMPECKSAVEFYKRCGFEYSHRIRDFYIDYYDSPLYLNGEYLTDMVYYRKKLV